MVVSWWLGWHGTQNKARRTRLEIVCLGAVYESLTNIDWHTDILAIWPRALALLVGLKSNHGHALARELAHHVIEKWIHMREDLHVPA